MNPSDLPQVERLFAILRDMTEQERSSTLDTEAPSDTVRTEVESLLKGHDLDSNGPP